MKRSTKLWIALAVVVVIAAAITIPLLVIPRRSSVTVAKKVLLVIVDGIPADVIENATVPNMKRLGTYQRTYTGGEIGTYSETPTISAPGYMNIITGTWGNKHNVYDNNVNAPRYNYKNIFQLLKEQEPDRKIGIYSTWIDNRLKLIGEGLPETGNITFDYVFDGYELDEIEYPPDSIYSIRDIDERVANESAISIKNDAPDLSWIYLQYTDDVSHRFGDSPEFYQSVNDLDRLIEQIIDSVEYRIDEWQEDWLVVITTDHGRDAGTGHHHGGNSERERLTWIWTNLQNTNDYFETEIPAAVDILPTMAKFMNIEIPLESLRELDGVSLIGEVSLIKPTLSLAGDLLNVTWKWKDGAGDVKVWLSTTNSFENGQTDDYQHIGTVPLQNQAASFNITDYPSTFYKVLLEGQYNMMVSLPVLSGFGLIFKDKLSSMGMSVKDISTITSTNSACSMLIGLVTGPLLKNLGYRKVALIAGSMFITGIVSTGFANSFCYFILSYSILTAAAFGLLNSSFSLALNTYFRKKRSKAAGTAVTITGLGPILYPPMITAMLNYYGVHGCMLILGGLSTHIIAAALLLQPIKYHLIYQTTDEELAGLKDAKENATKIDTLTANEYDGSNNAVGQPIEPIPNTIEGNSVADKMNELERFRFFGFDNSMDKPNELKNCRSCANGNTLRELETNSKKVSSVDKDQVPHKTTILSGVVRCFDLDLLKDVRFLNIIAGTAIATFAELSFSSLTPFILSDMAFSNIEIATFLSTLSVADIASRFLSPFVGDYLAIPTRVMYMVGLAFLIVFRMSVLLCDNLTKLLILGACMGVAKGIRTVYMILVIPNHVTINKLASALGIRMVSNGIVVLCLGPLVGWIRDFTGSYVICIVFMNCLTLTCITMWTTELLYFKFKYKSTKT